MVRSINLDGMFVPIPAPEIEYKLDKFSGGEIHIVLNNNIDYSDIDKVIITHRVNSSDNLMEILHAKNALEMKGVTKFDLVMPYVPYARQDRVCNDGESFSLKVFATLINNQNFNKVYVLDSHSDVAPALIDRCINVPSEEYIYRSIVHMDVGDLLHAIPDAGASKKATKIEKHVAEDKQTPHGKIIKGIPFKGSVQCGKVRETKDGKLLWFAVHATDLFNTDCLIIDDICDGGGTFMGLAEELKKKNAGDLYLFVTHLIASKGLEGLKKHFKRIYTTNSVKDFDDDFVKQIKINL